MPFKKKACPKDKSVHPQQYAQSFFVFFLSHFVQGLVYASHDSSDSHKQPSSYSFLQLLLWFRTWTWSIHAQYPHPHLAEGWPWRWKLNSSLIKPFPDTPKWYRWLSRYIWMVPWQALHLNDFLVFFYVIDGDETTTLPFQVEPDYIEVPYVSSPADNTSRSGYSSQS